MKFGNREGEKNPPKELADKPLPEWTPAERGWMHTAIEQGLPEGSASDVPEVHPDRQR